MWWALIEEIAPHAKEMTGEKQMVCCVRGYHIYKSIWAAAIGVVLVCHCWCVVVGKFSLLKNQIHIKYFHMLSVFENIFHNEKRELQYMFAPSCNHKWLHQTIVTCMWPFGHVPFAAFASNWLTAATWVPNWSAYHSRSTEETTLRSYKNHYE